jgi:hypothetical protein
MLRLGVRFRGGDWEVGWCKRAAGFKGLACLCLDCWKSTYTVMFCFGVHSGMCCYIGVDVIAFGVYYKELVKKVLPLLAEVTNSYVQQLSV